MRCKENRNMDATNDEVTKRANSLELADNAILKAAYMPASDSKNK